MEQVRTEVESRVPIPSGGTFSMANPPAYEIQKMRENHFDIVHFSMFGKRSDGCNLTQKEIAEKVGCTEAMVSYTLNSTVVQMYIAQIRGQFTADAVEVQRQIQGIAPIALQVATDVMMSPGTKAETKLRAAQDFLDRAGHKAAEVKIVGHATSVEIQEAIKRAKSSEYYESGDGSVEDAQFVEEM